MIWIIITLVLLTFLLFPMRIKITTVYENRMMHIYLFNKELNLKEKVAKEETNVRNYKIAKRKIYGMFRQDLKAIFHKLSVNPHKLKASMKFELTYGFQDAALTGICCALFSSMGGFVYSLLTNILKIRDYNFDVIPDFKQPQFNFRVTSIIYFNLAKLIYILVIIYRR